MLVSGSRGVRSQRRPRDPPSTEPHGRNDMRLMRAPRRALLGGLSSVALLVMTSFPVQAQDELIIVEPALATMYLRCI